MSAPLFEAMRNSFHEDLLLWEIKSLTTMLENAASREPQLIERGLLDALFALRFKLIAHWVKRAGEPSNADGSRGRGGKPVDAAEWELRTYALASVDALTRALGGHGHKAKAQRFVADAMNHYGVLVGTENYFEYARRISQPRNYPVDLNALRRATTEQLDAAYARGERVEDYIRAGIAMRCRIVQLIKKGGVVFDAANRVVP